MVLDLQKAGLWKRIAAWIFDWILIGILAVGLGTLLSMMLCYNSYSETMDAAYARYESDYGITFDISQAEYAALTQGAKEAYDAAYGALIADENALYAYNMMSI